MKNTQKQVVEPRTEMQMLENLFELYFVCSLLDKYFHTVPTAFIVVLLFIMVLSLIGGQAKEEPLLDICLTVHFYGKFMRYLNPVCSLIVSFY